MAQTVDEFDEGSVVESKLVDENNELYVQQSAERSSNDIRHELLVTGGRILQNLDSEVIPNLYSFQYGTDFAQHRLEYIEGRYPETCDDWREVGEALDELHEQGIERLNYGQFTGYTDWDHLGLVRAYHHWNEFLDQNIEAYIESISDEVLNNSQRQILQAGWKKSAIPKEPEKTVIHNDLVPSNAIIDEEKAYLIDLDQALHGDKIFDLVKAEESLIIRGIEPEPLKEGYNLEKNISEELRKAYQSYALAYEAWSIDESNNQKSKRVSDRIEELF